MKCPYKNWLDSNRALVLDADLLEAVLGSQDSNKKAREIDIKVARRLREHLHYSRFRALGVRG